MFSFAPKKSPTLDLNSTWIYYSMVQLCAAQSQQFDMLLQLLLVGKLFTCSVNVAQCQASTHSSLNCVWPKTLRGWQGKSCRYLEARPYLHSQTDSHRQADEGHSASVYKRLEKQKPDLLTSFPWKPGSTMGQRRTQQCEGTELQPAYT